MQDPDPKCRQFVISWHFMAFWHVCQKANCITKSAFSRLFPPFRLFSSSFDRFPKTLVGKDKENSLGTLVDKEIYVKVLGKDDNLRTVFDFAICKDEAKNTRMNTTLCKKDKGKV